MRAERFFDTNVLVYAFSADDPRSAVAEELLAEGGTVGVQVINEFTNVTHRKLKWSWEHVSKAIAVIDELAGPATPLTPSTSARARACAKQHGLHYYDALIVAAAQESGCQVLCSEDFQHGRRFGSLVVQNPFRELVRPRLS